MAPGAILICNGQVLQVIKLFNRGRIKKQFLTIAVNLI